MNIWYVSYTQTSIRVSGFVKDAKTDELLINANVWDTINNKMFQTDYNGYFSISIKRDALLRISYIGYEKRYIRCNFTNDTLLSINLKPNTKIEEVIIKANKFSQSDIVSLNLKELSQLPYLGGKPDISKSLQLLPGITSQNEGSSLLIVRGGDPGQNLYLFDGVPLIYVNHLGGFSSVFNPDIINNIDVFKGAFPAYYGGKLSSIVDITQKEGNKYKKKSVLSIGTLDISYCFETPLKLKNSSMIIAARKTLIDPIMILASKLSEGGNYIISYGYHDINAKFNWKPNIKNNFNINLYQGDDYINYWGNSKNIVSTDNYHISNIWGNLLISFNWKTIIAKNTFISNSLSYTRYRLRENMKYKIENKDYTQKYLSSVQDISFRSNWKSAFFENWNINYGFQLSYLLHNPNEQDISGKTSRSYEKIKSFDAGLYFDNTIDIFQKVRIDAGGRVNIYTSENYNNFSFDPRIATYIQIAKNNTISASYMQVQQNTHLLFTQAQIMNNEIWIPANKETPSASAEQISLNWKATFIENKYTAEANIYYKKMNNLATYKEGYNSLKGDANWKSKIESNGVGTAKGIELLFKKVRGKYTGFISYALSNSTRKYPEINNGKEFLFDFDRLHTFSLNFNHKINNKLNFNLVWIYKTGLPYTPAIGRQYTPTTNENNIFYYQTLIYGERNSAKMKNYHRLDIGFSYTVLTKKYRKAVWSFSIYNAYNRKNPYYYYYNTNNTDEIYYPETGQENKPIYLYQISYFPIIPSISYKVYFNHIRNKKDTKNKFKNWLFYKN